MDARNRSLDDWFTRIRTGQVRLPRVTPADVEARRRDHVAAVTAYVEPLTQPPDGVPDLDDPSRPTLRFHDLRHTFASLLIAQGTNVVFVARQLGHASPDITLSVYAHLFDSAEHGERAMAMLEADFGEVVGADRS